MFVLILSRVVFIFLFTFDLFLKSYLHFSSRLRIPAMLISALSVRISNQYTPSLICFSASSRCRYLTTQDMGGSYAWLLCNDITETTDACSQVRFLLRKGKSCGLLYSSQLVLLSKRS
ncbi:hypothetical protein BZA70DRAFT_275405, partial [Myxozyma melibiosi]